MLYHCCVFFLGMGLLTLASCAGSVDPADVADAEAARLQAMADSIAALPRAQVQIETRYGSMTIELFNETPLHRDNFVEKVKTGFYDSLLVHRVQPNFMAQGGDPDSKGEVPPDQFLGTKQLTYTIPAEIQSGFILRHGAVCGFHNNHPEKASHGSQFMLIHGQPLRTYQVKQVGLDKNRVYTPEELATYEQYGGLPQHDGKYTVFGQVIEGDKILDQIVYAPTLRSTNPSLPDRPIEDIRLQMTLLRDVPGAL